MSYFRSLSSQSTRTALKSENLYSASLIMSTTKLPLITLPTSMPFCISLLTKINLVFITPF